MQNQQKPGKGGEHKKCPYCRANMKMYWQPLSKGLVKTLIKFRQEVIKRNRNKIHIAQDMNFTKTEFNNFQKLRYHGLVTKWINPDTKIHDAGYWLLTRRGNLFAKNLISLPFKVQTYRNRIVDKSPELYYINDLLGSEDLPTWENIETLEFDFADITDVEDVSFNENGQGEMFTNSNPITTSLSNNYAIQLLQLNLENQVRIINETSKQSYKNDYSNEMRAEAIKRKFDLEEAINLITQK